MSFDLEAERAKRPSEDEEENANSKRIGLGGEDETPIPVNIVDNDAVAVAGNNLPQERLTLKALLQSKDVGALIGKGGLIIKSIREATNCRVIISESTPNTNERILTVLGAPTSVAEAYGQIAVRLQNEASTAEPPSNQLTINLLVANSQIGPLIGKGGSKIKEIREVTNAHLSVASEPLPGSTERSVAVSGNVDAVAMAIATIAAIVFNNPPKGPVVPFRPQARLEHMNMMPSGMQQPPRDYRHDQQYAQQSQSSHGLAHRDANGMGSLPQANHQQPGPGETTQIVTVPNEYIGAIIGKAGVKINEI
eukprot:Ihof_evm1s854 gene=Ihof_evmTU1s854